MVGRAILGTLGAVAAAASGLAAAEPSPYAAWQGRPIKALSAAQIEGYLEGRGMEMALPAELNGHPGPRHVLDLADELGLTPAQRETTERLFEDMRRTAIALGERVVAGEAELDRLFASGTVEDTRLHQIAGELGRLSGQLRAHHLRYHLLMRDLLTPAQTRHYQELRGYAGSVQQHDGGHGHHGG